MAPKVTFVLSESPFWPKSPLSCFSVGAQRIMVSNGSLIKCQDALWDQVYVNELNTSSLLQSLCIKLPQRMQRKWSENVCMILSRAQRRTTFVDFVEFVRKESEVANDPTFSREALSKVIDKKPVNFDQSKALKGGSKTRVDSFATRSENCDASAETAVKDHLSPHCSKEHDLDDCKDFLAKSLYAPSSLCNPSEFVDKFGKFIAVIVSLLQFQIMHIIAISNLIKRNDKYQEI